MKRLVFLFQDQTKRIIAIVLVLSLWLLVRSPILSADLKESLASQFKFERLPLPELNSAQTNKKSINSNIRSVQSFYFWDGASVALNDLDNDGLANDICYVDTRSDQVIITPVPGTPNRYQPFELNASPLPYKINTMQTLGCLPADFNEDGLSDILVRYWGRTPIIFLRKTVESQSPNLNRQSYLAREIVPQNPLQSWHTTSAITTDLDGDSHLDLILGLYYPEDLQIFNSNGGSYQLDESKGGGYNHILRWIGATSGVEPNVTFQEVKGVLPEKIARSWTLAIGAADLDGDLLPEIYLANDTGNDRTKGAARDYFLHNESQPGQLKFALVKGDYNFLTSKSLSLGRDIFSGMGIDFGDLNYDGWLDFFVSNIGQPQLSESHFLFMSTGKVDSFQKGLAPYIETSQSMGLSRSGWAWDVRFGDFNNDTVAEIVQATGMIKGKFDAWPELQERSMRNDAIKVLRGVPETDKGMPDLDISGSQHNAFFVQAESGYYYDIAEAIKMNDTQVTRGIALADVEGDGDLDLAIANQWEPSYFYLNESPSLGAFLGLHLLLPTNNKSLEGVKISSGHPHSNLTGRPAIGACAILHLPDGRKIAAQSDGGSGHSGVRSPEIHFGLGDIDLSTKLKVELRWRDVDGNPHQKIVTLSPGWHTLILGTETLS